MLDTVNAARSRGGRTSEPASTRPRRTAHPAAAFALPLCHFFTLRTSLFAAFLLLAPVAARAADVTDYVPADAMAVVAGRPLVHLAPATTSAATSQPESQGFLQQILFVAMQLKILPPEARTLGDIAGCMPLLGRYPYAFVLFDITAKPLPRGGHRLAQMQAAMVFHTDGDHKPVIQRIRQLLAAYANDEVSRLETIPSGAGTRYRLIDSRLPDWAVIEWGAIGRQFVVSIGPGAFDRMLAVHDNNAPSLASDPWYAGACGRAGVHRAFFECSASVGRMRARLSEVLGDLPARVLRSVGGEKLDRIVLLVGTQERAVTGHVVANAEGMDHHIVLSEPVPPGDPLAAMIPAGIRRYGFARQPVAVWFRGIRDAFLASQGDSTTDALSDKWAALEEQFGFSVERDFFGHLGNRLIVHDYPLHPLHIPLLWTYLIETDGDEEAVRRGVDGLFRAWQATMAKKAGTQPAGGLTPQIRRTQDGIWFIQLGLAGPAVKVTPRWIIVGFSPEAVRQNLRYLPGAASRSAVEPPPVDTAPAAR